MASKAENSLTVAGIAAAIVYGIYQLHVPSAAATRASEPMNDHIEKSRKAALWTSMIVVGGISLLASDPAVFIVGGGMAIALEVSHRHANMTDNLSGKISGSVDNSGVSASASATY